MTFEAWGTEAGRIEAKSDLSTGSGQRKQRAGEDVPAPAVLLAGAWRLVHSGCDRCDYGEFLQKITVQSTSISQLSQFAKICSKTLIDFDILRPIQQWIQQQRIGNEPLASL